MVQNLNQFAQSPERGQIAMQGGEGFILSAQIASTVNTPVLAGDLLEIVGTSKDVIQVQPVSSGVALGYVVWSPIKTEFKAQDMVEIVITGGIVRQVASAAIVAGANVTYTADTGKVVTATTGESATAVNGVALDAASADGDLIRVYAKTI